MPPPSLLTIEDLSVHFETKRGVVHAVDGVNLEISAGETLGLVGETGSGKSVTARSLLRLVPVPPAIIASGRALFQTKVTCTSCVGEGCAMCAGTGRIGAPCPACAGVGCEQCDQSGQETLDLLRIPISRMRRIRGNHIAMIFQDPGKALNPAMPIRDQIAEVFAEHRADELLQDAGVDADDAGILLRRLARRRAGFWERKAVRLSPKGSRYRRLEAVLDERIARALADTRIPNPRKIMNSYAHELSGGMKQRVMIAQALACDPDLLVADEPTTALDVTIQARILDLLSELQQRHQMAVLYISHDLSVVRSVCDRVAVMYAGRLVEAGATEQVFRRPLHPYTRGLLAAIPTPRQRRGELEAIRGHVPELVDPPVACRFSSRCPNAGPACSRIDPELSAPNLMQADHRVACLLYEASHAIGVDADDMPDARSAP